MHDEVGKLLWVNATGRGVARQTDVQRYPTTSKESKWVNSQRRTEKTLWWQPWSSLKTMNLVFNVSSDKQDNHSDDIYSSVTTILYVSVWDDIPTVYNLYKMAIIYR